MAEYAAAMPILPAPMTIPSADIDGLTAQSPIDHLEIPTQH
jgi:hypothetical protein